MALSGNTKKQPEQQQTQPCVPRPELEGLVCFLYLILRDELSAGYVEKQVMDSEKAREGSPITYSNRFLEGYARELAGRLTTVYARG